MLLLSLMPAIGTLLSPFWSIVVDNTCTYFDGVWSKLMVKEGGIWCFSTLLTIWCRNFSSFSFWGPTGIFTLPVVFIWWTKLRQRIRLWSKDLPNSRWSFSKIGYHFVSTFAVAIATMVFTTPPLYLTALRYFWTNGLILFPSKHGPLWSLLTITVFRDLFFRILSFIWASQRFLNPRIVLSFIRR